MTLSDNCCNGDLFSCERKGLIVRSPQLGQTSGPTLFTEDFHFSRCEFLGEWECFAFPSYLYFFSFARASSNTFLMRRSPLAPQLAQVRRDRSFDGLCQPEISLPGSSLRFSLEDSTVEGVLSCIPAVRLDRSGTGQRESCH